MDKRRISAQNQRQRSRSLGSKTQGDPRSLCRNSRPEVVTGQLPVTTGTAEPCEGTMKDNLGEIPVHI